MFVICSLSVAIFRLLVVIFSLLAIKFNILAVIFYNVKRMGGMRNNLLIHPLGMSFNCTIKTDDID